MTNTTNKHLQAFEAAPLTVSIVSVGEFLLDDKSINAGILIELVTQNETYKAFGFWDATNRLRYIDIEALRAYLNTIRKYDPGAGSTPAQEALRVEPLIEEFSTIHLLAV